MRIALSIPVVLLLLTTSASIAQDMSTRFGFGVGVVINPSNPEVSPEDFGFDLRFRISRPMTSSLSFAVGVGALLFGEETQTEVVLNPQAVVIATMGGDKRFPYFMVGGGALLPADQDRDAQLTLTVGYGWAWPFGSRTSFYLELNPMVAFSPEGLALLVPARGGLIF